MKSLKDYSLIYDDQCPLCQTYTKAFVLTGVLDENGRQAFQEVSEETCSLIDRKRACNEIALVNHKTGEVIYGIDSILKIITTVIPFTKFIFHFPPIHWILKKMYSFISFNRKVIMPSKNINDTCTPDFNLKYRLIYLFFTWSITAFILMRYSIHFYPLINESSFGREFLICGGQILFQSIILHKLSREKLFQYLGNMMTISFAGALLIGLFQLAGTLFSIVSTNYYFTSFFIVVFLMLLEHLRRVKLMQLTLLPTITWVIYRIIVLLILLAL